MIRTQSRPIRPAAARPTAAGRPAPGELTVRALLVGCGIGVVLAAGNVYTSLKTSFIDGGSITAALLGFTFFATFKGLARRPTRPLENNITQTTAASAAVMSFVLGAGGPLSALAMMGKTYPGWQLVLWTLGLGLLGIFIARAAAQQADRRRGAPLPHRRRHRRGHRDHPHRARHGAEPRAAAAASGAGGGDVLHLVPRRTPHASSRP